MQLNFLVSRSLINHGDSLLLLLHLMSLLYLTLCNNQPNLPAALLKVVRGVGSVHSTGWEPPWGKARVQRHLASPHETAKAHAAQVAFQSLWERSHSLYHFSLNTVSAVLHPQAPISSSFSKPIYHWVVSPKSADAPLLKLLTDRLMSRPLRSYLPGLRVSIPFLCQWDVGKRRAKPTGIASDRDSQAPCKGLLVWLKGCKECKNSMRELYRFPRSSLQLLTPPLLENQMAIMHVQQTMRPAQWRTASTLFQPPVCFGPFMMLLRFGTTSGLSSVHLHRLGIELDPCSNNNASHFEVWGGSSSTPWPPE